MRYLIVQDWISTHGNHAGMVHMCKLLCERFPNKYRMFVKDSLDSNSSVENSFFNKIKRCLKCMVDRMTFVKGYLKLCTPMFTELKEGDEVFLLEYHMPYVSQYELAKYIRKNFPFVRLYGLSHLTPSCYKTFKGGGREIYKWTTLLDKQLTLGSSLSDFFEKVGVERHKISTGFHYVDNLYYYNNVKFVNNPITIIAIGALQRDFQLLADIVRSSNNVKWIICKGRKNIDELFSGLKNVTLVGYVHEDELKRLMSLSDLSLNVLEDTVGSNVITTSMAMGLGIIVSDVGSIHDYCDNNNAVFCSNTVESFTNAIKSLSLDKEKILAMKKSSLAMSTAFEIQKIDEWFDTLKY